MDNLMERKKEVVSQCLDVFVEKGLAETTTRDLSSAMGLQNGALYYYFESKDEVVIACAEEAAIRLENNLITVVLKEIDSIETMTACLKESAKIMAPTMKFLIQVCSTPKYNDDIKKVLKALNKRYKVYAQRIADKLRCKITEIEPYLCIYISAVSNYMIFDEEDWIIPQIKFLMNHFNTFV